jgi:hypothetical protein
MRSMTTTSRTECRPAGRVAVSARRLLVATAVLLLAVDVDRARAEDAPGVPVRGRVTVRGSKEVPKQFEFTLRLRGPVYDAVEATGQGGRFELRVPREGTYIVAAVRIDGAPCHTRIPNVEVAAGRDLEIVVDPLAQAVLDVTDAATGRPVEGARAYREGPSGGLVFDPGTWEELEPVLVPNQIPDGATLAQGPLRTDVSGKVALPPVRGPVVYSVVAAGYAWITLEVPAAPPTPVPVRLKPGGTLALRVAGWSELLEPELTLWDAGGRMLWVPAPDAKGSLQVEGLAVGEYTVTVQRGGGPSPKTYGEAKIEIAAGRQTTATIETDRRIVGQVASFRGTLTIPASWRFAREVALEFHGADDETQGLYAHAELGEFTPGVPMPFPATPGLACGAYVVTVSPMYFRQHVELVPGGTHVEVQLPDPVEVRIRLIDDRTGREIREAKLAWMCPLRRGDGGFAEKARFDPKRQIFWLQAPPRGFLQLMPQARGYFKESVNIDLPSTGVVEREIRLRSVGVVIVRLQLDGTQYVTSGDVPVVLVPSKNPFGDRRNGLIEGGHAWIPEMSPGTYTVLVGSVPKSEAAPNGFARIGHREVDVKAGEISEVLIDLQRAK